MAVLSKSEIAALSTEERLTLIDDLWESLEPSAGLSESPVLEWQMPIVDERLLDLERFPADYLSLADARKQSLLG